MEGYEIDWSSLVALFAGLVALISAYFSKKSSDVANQIAKTNLSATIELQVSQFRQQWINELRQEMAGFSKCLLSGIWTEATLNQANSHAHKISLMMNPDDPLYGSLHMQISILTMRNVMEMAIDGEVDRQPGLQEMFVDFPAEVRDEEKYNANLFIKISQRILKSEWDRLKRDIGNHNA